MMTRWTTAPQRTVLVVAILASFAAFLDGSAVNVALPAISTDLGGGLSSQQWVVDAYLLSLGAFILLAGVALRRVRPQARAHDRSHRLRAHLGGLRDRAYRRDAHSHARPEGGLRRGIRDAKRRTGFELGSKSGATDRATPHLLAHGPGH